MSESLDALTSESAWIDHLVKLKWIIWSSEFREMEENLEEDLHEAKNADGEDPGERNTPLGNTIELLIIM